MDEKDLEKQKQDDASRKTAHVAGKGAATYFGGGLGGKLYDAASQTKVGQDLENAVGKSLQQVPRLRNTMEKLDDSGALDAANDGLNLANGENSLANPTDHLKNQFKDATNPSNSNMDTSPLSSNPSEQNANATFEGNSLISKKKKNIILISAICSFVFMIMIILILATLIFAPFNAAKNFISGMWDAVVDIFTKDKQELETEYYQELKNVQQQINYQSGQKVCIDINLITAALTVNKSFDEMLAESQGFVEDSTNQFGSNTSGDGYDYEDDSESESEEKSNLKRMKKQVRLLANMQIINKKYGLDSQLKAETGTYCSSAGDIELVTSDNIDNYVGGKYGEIDSSNMQLVASHDKVGIAKFFSKKSNEETNYAYYIYHPPFDTDGTCSDRYAKKKVKELSEKDMELSIGDLSTKKENVYYWNLVNSFIPDYYADYLPKESDPEYQSQVEKLADDIYVLFKDIGPSQLCAINNSYICRNDEGANFYGGDTTNISRTQFMENASPIAIEEMTRTGVFASITLAQAALESGNGASSLSTKFSNYYGMTAGGCAPKNSPSTASGTVYKSGEGGNNCTGNAFWDGSVVAMCNSSGQDCQWYRIYDSFENSTKDHSRLLSDGYGCNVYGSYEEQLNCLVDHNYATDPNYTSKVSKLIRSYNLSEYDIGVWNGEIIPVSESQYNRNLCYSDGSVASGDFVNWKQYDPAWSKVPLGPQTVGKIGCAMTSVCIQIMRSGVSTTLGFNFNPGTFAQEMTSIGGFDQRGNIYWAKATSIASGFSFVNAVRRKAGPSELANLVNQGYYIILNVKNGRHWVAVDRVENNKIYMFDPGSPGTEVGETYGLDSIVGYVYYKKG